MVHCLVQFIDSFTYHSYKRLFIIMKAIFIEEGVAPALRFQPSSAREKRHKLYYLESQKHQALVEDK